MNSQAPYGYMKSPQDKHILIIDEEAANIVRRIFSDFVSGDSMRNIADRLNREGVDSPRFYHYRKQGKVNPLANEKNLWNSSSISQLMKNRVYLGHMVQGKRQVVSFKTKRRETLPPDSWIIVENTHEPIIEQSVWDRAQHRFKQHNPQEKRVSRTGELSLFSGILKCSNCGANLAFSERQLKSGVSGGYKCQGYVCKGRMACTSHFIKEHTLVSHVLDDIRQNALLAVEDEEYIVNALAAAMSKSEQETAQQLAKRQREIDTRINVITATLKKLYEDKCSGALPEAVFQNMMSNYTAEQATLLEQQEENARLLENRQDAEHDVSSWLSLVGKYQRLSSLDRCTVLELIDTVTIDERFTDDGKRILTITINYRFIGSLMQKIRRDTP